MTRTFRFGLVHLDGDVPSTARRTEAAGYDTVLFPDHLGMPAPMLAAIAAARSTTRVRVGTQVLNNDFRHPRVLVEEAATAVALTGGRFELGVDAGHMRSENEAVGLPFDPAPVRIARLAHTAALVRQLLPELPLFIGGNGDRLLTVAAQHAHIVGFTGFIPKHGGTKPTATHFSTPGLADRIQLVRNAAGQRFAQLELSVLVQQVIITDDRRAAAARIAEEAAADGEDLAIDVALDSPFLLLGTAADVARQVENLRDELGVSYVTVFNNRSNGFDDVVSRLASK